MKVQISCIGCVLAALIWGPLCVAEEPVVASQSSQTVLDVYNNADKLFPAWLAEGPNRPLPGWHGTTVAHLAAALGRVSVLRTLQQQGVDFNIVDEHGLTPLHYALAQIRIYKDNFHKQPVTLWMPFYNEEMSAAIMDINAYSGEALRGMNPIMEFSAEFYYSWNVVEFLLPLMHRETVDRIRDTYAKAIHDYESDLQERAAYYEALWEKETADLTPGEQLQLQVFMDTQAACEKFAEIQKKFDAVLGLSTKAEL